MINASQYKVLIATAPELLPSQKCSVRSPPAKAVSRGHCRPARWAADRPEQAQLIEPGRAGSDCKCNKMPYGRRKRD